MPYVLNLQNKKQDPKPKHHSPAAADASSRIKPANAPVDDEKQPHSAEHGGESADGAISWHAPEYEQTKKSPEWYWAVGILTVGLFVAAIIFNNILFGIFILFAGFTVALYGARPARTLMFTLSPEGVRIQNRVYPYETLQSFWLFYRPPDIKELSIESNKLMMPHIKIPLGNANPTAVRSHLLQFLPERPQEESLIDTVSRLIGF